LRVLYSLELTPAQGALGCQVVVPTLEGPVRLRIPPGSSTGRMLRLRGRGLALGEQSGDQLVEVRLVVPESLDEAQQALYGRLLELEQQVG
ncbi:MAG: DnaJ C-terminal domain-containing protein, partial [Cyanobacteriota bacterium]